MWHFGFRPSSLCAAELGKHWYLRKVLLLSSSGLTCLSWQSCHWPALASKSNFFPASELLYIFDSHHKFSRSLQLSKILFSQNTFCDHSLQSNRVSSHQPLLCMVCFIQNTYHSKILLSVFTRFSSLSSVGEGNVNPLQYSFPGESQGQGSPVGYRLWGPTESDTTEAT